MAEALELKAWTRARTGKGGARASRREGRIPGILYGDKGAPQIIDVDYKTINQQLHTGHFQSTIYMLDLDGAKTRVIPRQVQLDPIRDFPIHVDFMRIGEHSLVTVDVPVRFLNEAASPGIKRGGILNVVRHEIPVRCPADAIPEHFDVDLIGLEIGRQLQRRHDSWWIEIEAQETKTGEPISVPKPPTSPGRPRISESHGSERPRPPRRAPGPCERTLALTSTPFRSHRRSS